MIRDLSEEDVAPAAGVHREAFPDFFLTQLGEPFLKQFYKGFLDDPTAITAVAVDDRGQLLGAAVGTTRPDGFFKRLLQRQLVGFAVASARAVLADPTRTPRLVRAVAYRGGEGSDSSSALLSSIFVAPQAAGLGVGSTLMKEWCSRAASLGSDKARLVTDGQGNDKVNAFYRRCGWSLTQQFTTREGRQMNAYGKDLA
ncbi:GNAT family N-acetyltransferase [Intrasporangium sp. YIM S08009]|uniref:GNAT family N-acetyltransferase n=1 Tax=Intrasporangium zincisolvens TaxID=3080018 RepID=UPI002B057501|nr:GNAT family N-acetyltransferase [Intrasporangium sp. YIM S08009]